MSWAFNQIDIYLLTGDLPLGVYNTDTFIPVSRYGIVRGRPALTPSQMNTTGSTPIPGKNGVIYPASASNGNAKVQFDVLVENSWVHNETQNGTVQQRADILMALFRDAKVVSYKMPGCPANFYLKTTKKKDFTISNADKDCIVLQCTMEVVPFKYWFEGNKPILVETTRSFETHYPDVAKPSFWLAENGNSGRITVNGKYISTATGKTTTRDTIIDTEKGLVYYYDDEFGQIHNVNNDWAGDYKNLWFPRNATFNVSTTVGPIVVYTKEGVDL